MIPIFRTVLCRGKSLSCPGSSDKAEKNLVSKPISFTIPPHHRRNLPKQFFLARCDSVLEAKPDHERNRNYDFDAKFDCVSRFHERAPILISVFGSDEFLFLVIKKTPCDLQSVYQGFCVFRFFRKGYLLLKDFELLFPIEKRNALPLDGRTQPGLIKLDPEQSDFVLHFGFAFASEFLFGYDFPVVCYDLTEFVLHIHHPRKLYHS